MSPETLTEREERVLEAVIRTYVETAEPAGSRTIARRFKLGVSAATVRNTMADLEEKGFLYHPHTSAGRIPTDVGYRYYVDTLMRPMRLTATEQRMLRKELDTETSSAIEDLILRSAQAMGLLAGELGVAIAPRLGEVVLEKLELVSITAEKVLLVLTLKNGLVRTIYVDLPADVPHETLVSLTVILNERLAGLTLAELRQTLSERLRDAGAADRQTSELLNIFFQQADDVFDFDVGGEDLLLGRTSILASQPEFSEGRQLRGLIELTEKRELLLGVLSSRDHDTQLSVSIGTEHPHPELSGFTLVTAEYNIGDLTGVIGVIGPTRMPYEKVVSIVDSTSRLVTDLHASRTRGSGGGADARDRDED